MRSTANLQRSTTTGPPESAQSRRAAAALAVVSFARDGAPHADRGRDLERRALHALRRAARRRAAARAAAPGRRASARSSPPTPTARARPTGCSAARWTGSPREAYVLVGAVGHDFYEGEREGAKGFPRFTDPRAARAGGVRGLPALATEASLERCGVDALRPAAAAQPRPHRLHERGRVGRDGGAARRRADARCSASRPGRRTASRST